MALLASAKHFVVIDCNNGCPDIRRVTGAANIGTENMADRFSRRDDAVVAIYTTTKHLCVINPGYGAPGGSVVAGVTLIGRQHMANRFARGDNPIMASGAAA